MPSSLEHQILDAADRGDLNEVRRLQDAGAPVDAVTNGRYPWTPLMHAAFKGHLEIVEFLLARGADPNHEDLDYFSPASLAARQKHWDILKLLARSGANIDVADGSGRTVRDYARSAGQTDLS